MKLQNILLESDEQQMAAQIKAVLDKELKDGELNEVLDPVSILSYLLLSNTVIDILGKYSAKVLRKLNLDKAADKAEAIHNWAHSNEKAMVKELSSSLGSNGGGALVESSAGKAMLVEECRGSKSGEQWWEQWC